MYRRSFLPNLSRSQEGGRKSRRRAWFASWRESRLGQPRKSPTPGTNCRCRWRLAEVAADVRHRPPWPSILDYFSSSRSPGERGAQPRLSACDRRQGAHGGRRNFVRGQESEFAVTQRARNRHTEVMVFPHLLFKFDGSKSLVEPFYPKNLRLTLGSFL